MKRLGVSAMAVVAVVFALAACGGGSSPRVASLGSPTTTTAAPAAGGTGTPADLAGRLEQFAKCMRSHGVPEFPEAVVQPGGQLSMQISPALAQTPRFSAAATACQALSPKPVARRPSITPQQQQDYLNAARCMRAHGINGFPDPVFSGGGVQFPIPPNIDANSPSVLAARQVCQQLIPAGLPYSGRGGA